MFKKKNNDEMTEKEIVKELEKLEKNLDALTKSMQGDFIKMIESAAGEEFKINMGNDGDHTSCEISGGRLTLLINLAGLEQSLLEKLDCPKEEFEFLKGFIDGIETYDTKEEYEKALGEKSKEEK